MLSKFDPNACLGGGGCRAPPKPISDQGARSKMKRMTEDCIRLWWMALDLYVGESPNLGRKVAATTVSEVVKVKWLRTEERISERR